MLYSATSAKVIYAQQNNLYSLNIKVIEEQQIKDGEIINIQKKNIGTLENYPTSLKCSSNGRNLAILFEKEFAISSSAVYRRQADGNCQDIDWGFESDFIIKDFNTVKVINCEVSGNESHSFKPGYLFEGVFGGPFLSVKTQESVLIYDYEFFMCIRKIDVVPDEVKWNEQGTKLALICPEVTYILKVNTNSIQTFIDDHKEQAPGENECCDDAFEIEHTISEKLVSTLWVEDILVFVNTRGKINYLIGIQVFQISTLQGQ